uniref:CRAL-TRIO domain-containing protein n=1 Tax=Strongyloides papillosus TaxID=174720 RepID=A0A0N5C228_STREA
MTVESKFLLNEETIEKINKLRELVKDYLTPYYDTNFNLLRWIQGHPGKIEDVSEKLITHLKNRSSVFKFDDMIKDSRNHPIHNHWKYGITKMSSVLENTIVNIEQCGETDYWGLTNTYSMTEVLRARLYDLEDMLSHVMRIEKETGKQAYVLYIIDLGKLKYDRKLIPLITGPLKCLSDFMSDNYVELFNYFVLVNAPSSMSYLWSIIKPLLPEKTRSKVKILSNNWRNEILQYAGPDELPSKWNLDPNNNNKINFQVSLENPIPFNENNLYQNRNEMKTMYETIKVSPGKRHFIMEKLVSGQKLNWFISTNLDFSFAVYFTADKNETNHSNMEVVFPYFEFINGPTAVPLSDTITATKNGYYKILLSNHRAWWNTLMVEYKITIN